MHSSDKRIECDAVPIKTTNRSRRTKYRELFHLTHYATMRRAVDEISYISILQQLTVRGFRTYHVPSIIRMIDGLRTEGLIDSFNISLLLYLRDIWYREICCITRHFHDLTTILREGDSPICEKLERIDAELRQRIVVIGSFKAIERLNRCTRPCIDLNALLSLQPTSVGAAGSAEEDSPGYFVDLASRAKEGTQVPHDETDINYIDLIQNGNSIGSRSHRTGKIMSGQSSINRSTIQSALRHEMINRLHWLIERYSIAQLRFIGCQLIGVVEIGRMTDGEIESYYHRTIDRIAAKLKRWREVVAIYRTIDRSYRDCCMRLMKGCPTSIDPSLSGNSVFVRFQCVGQMLTC